MVGVRFNKQRELTHEACLGRRKISLTLHPPARILRVYIEALAAFSHVYSPGRLTLLSQGGDPELGLSAEIAGEMYISGTRVRRLLLTGSSSQDDLWSYPLDDLLQQSGEVCFRVQKQLRNETPTKFTANIDREQYLLSHEV